MSKEVFIIYKNKKISLGYIKENESGIYPCFQTQYTINNGEISIFMTYFKTTENCLHRAVFDLYNSDGDFIQYFYDSNENYNNNDEIVLSILEN